ncbi:MAG: elongation factor P--(R)-beta-lysine ligase [Planctomycetota bacterium]|nr:elongation factor P--(R)-beta-lysine ligase [Planctomycetota bacterium]
MTHDWRPTANIDRLQLRAKVVAQLRRFFDARGFLEVETPLLSADTVIDRHLDPFSTVLADDPRRPVQGQRLWLQTSPEFAMKRLLAAGATAIYQICKAFRNGDRGRMHNPEFTMVEWYRVGDDMQRGMQLLAELIEEMLPGTTCSRISYQQAFLQYLQIDPHRATVAELQAAAARKYVTVPADFGTDRDNWLNLLLAECVEPHLGTEGPVLLFDYPASQAALAVVRHDDPPVAERFELYLYGIELANGYHELLDPTALRKRNQAANTQRMADGKPALPEESRLLEAMQHGLPPCAGVALGLDRLVMLIAGEKSLDEVIAFPIDRA